MPARLEERSASYAVVGGRVETLDERRAELAGALSLEAGSSRPDPSRRHTLVARGHWWPVVRLEPDGPDAGGRSRWRFVASCVPSDVRHLIAGAATGEAEPAQPEAVGEPEPGSPAPDDDPPLEVDD